MCAMDNLRNIPEGWRVVHIGKYIKLQGGFAFKSTEFKTSGIPIIKISNLDGKYIDLSNCVYSCRNNISNAFIIEKNDVLIAMSGATTGKVGKYKNKKKAYLNQRVGKFSIKDNEKIYLDFIYQIVLEKNFFSAVMIDAIGGVQPNISSGMIETIKFLLPPLSDQKKIAEILGSVDRSIEATEKLIAKLADLKKALMQELFTKGIGHIKFKDSPLGKIPKEWEVVKIGEKCKCIVPGRNKPKQFQGNIPWITTPDIDNFYISLSKQKLMLSKEEVKVCNNKIVPKGAVVMSCVGDFGIVGITTCQIVMNQQLHAFLPPKNINNQFIAFFLLSQLKQMKKLGTMTAIPYLNKENCNSILIALPDYNEQKQIVSILSANDAKIEKAKKKLAKLQDLKKGLMQDLLTGKVRVGTSENSEASDNSEVSESSDNSGSSDNSENSEYSELSYSSYPSTSSDPMEPPMVAEDRSIYLKSGGYRKLRTFQTATVIYDGTVFFCNRFIDKRSRTHDQMVQAARSGRQNIAEGSQAAATSAKSEAFLTNVAKASLEELLLDYEDFLRQNRLRQWNKDDELACQVRSLAKFAKEDPTEHYKVYQPWIEHQSPEISANTMICLIHQADYLLDRQLKYMSEKFRKDGGFGEKMLNTRLKEKGYPPKSPSSPSSRRTQITKNNNTPACPKCASTMVLRTAHKGVNAGNKFWGCSKYPDCKGTREFEKR